MSQEQRLYSRKQVNWRGHVTLSDGPEVSAVVTDVSAGGAKLLLSVDSAPRRHELMELTAFRHGLLPSWAIRPVHVHGRAVRIQSSADNPRQIEVAMRFHTPLQQWSPSFLVPRFSENIHLDAERVPCA